MIWYARYMNETGTGLRGLIEAWSANASTIGLSLDLGIAAAAFTVWVLVECIPGRHWWGLVAIPATFGIGLSCGLPLYLALRRPAPSA
jgi:hypothetical protein